MEGPAVMPLQTGFAQNWLQATGELITGFEFYPDIDTPAGPLSVQTIISSPETGASTARTFYYLSIAAARRKIYIANPYFVPDQGAIDLLVSAKTRGVDVRIMVAGIHNDNWLARQNGIRLYHPLLEAASRFLNTTRQCSTRRRWSSMASGRPLASTNFDSRSFAHNEENNVLLRYALAGSSKRSSPGIAGCNAVTLDAWKRRGVVQRSVQAVVSLLQEQV
jgi:cardiolipin synthase